MTGPHLFQLLKLDLTDILLGSAFYAGPGHSSRYFWL
jgi:hypothetical protein